jgi:competence protein ComEC
MKRWLCLLLACGVAGLLSLTVPAASQNPDTLRVSFLNVGQGDATLITSSRGTSLLVDGGRGDAGPKVLRALRRARIDRLDYVIGSHPHEDHIGGLIPVLRRVPARRALDPGYNHGTPTQRTYLTLLREAHTTTTKARAGNVVLVGPITRLEILAPSEPLLRDTHSDANNASIVFRLGHDSRSFLFTGDLESEGRERLMSQVLPEKLKSDVLKVAHHGSHNGTEAGFVHAVQPRYAVISSGGEYGHPHQPTLDTLAQYQVRVLRTDAGRRYSFTTNGTRLRLH